MASEYKRSTDGGLYGPCWEVEFRQSSFHHASRVLRRVPYIALGRPPLSAHAIVPSGFHLQVRAVAQETFLEFPPHYVGFTVARRTARCYNTCDDANGSLSGEQAPI
jgi:hypothetical protein